MFDDEIRGLDKRLMELREKRRKLIAITDFASELARLEKEIISLTLSDKAYVKLKCSHERLSGILAVLMAEPL